jgi:uncharacterized protein (TIGR02271 family)
MSMSDEIVPVIEEVLTIEKQSIVSGRVRLETRTETVDELVGASLATETIDIRRVPINRVVSVAPEVRTEGDVTIVPVMEEVLVVHKQLVLKEELHLTRVVTQQTHELPVRLHKQRAEITRLGGDAQPQED